MADRMEIYGMSVEVDERIPPGVVVIGSGDKTYVLLADGRLVEVYIEENDG